MESPGTDLNLHPRKQDGSQHMTKQSLCSLKAVRWQTLPILLILLTQLAPAATAETSEPGVVAATTSASPGAISVSESISDATGVQVQDESDRIIDDKDGIGADTTGFVRRGPEAGWFIESDFDGSVTYNSQAQYTHAANTWIGHNYNNDASWTLPEQLHGRWSVHAFIPDLRSTNAAPITDAAYTVVYGSRPSQRETTVIDQRPPSRWAYLGTYEFDGSTLPSVSLNDVSQSPITDDVHSTVLYDAVRWSPADIASGFSATRCGYLETLPLRPNSESPTTLVLSGTSSTMCIPEYDSHSISGNIINVYLKHCQQILCQPSITDWTTRIPLGTLTSGNFSVRVLRGCPPDGGAIQWSECDRHSFTVADATNGTSATLDAFQRIYGSSQHLPNGSTVSAGTRVQFCISVGARAGKHSYVRWSVQPYERTVWFNERGGTYCLGKTHWSPGRQVHFTAHLLGADRQTPIETDFAHFYIEPEGINATPTTMSPGTSPVPSATTTTTPPRPGATPLPSPTPTVGQPIVFIPGIGGSSLVNTPRQQHPTLDCSRRPAGVVWPPFPPLLGINDRLDTLRIAWQDSQSGSNFESHPCDNVYPTFLEAPVFSDYGGVQPYDDQHIVGRPYRQLISTWRANNIPVFVLPYDWRYQGLQPGDLGRAAYDAKGVLRLYNDHGPFTIVAHSMGGLLADALLLDMKYWSDLPDSNVPDVSDAVRAVINVGTPYSGAPELLRRAINGAIAGNDPDLTDAIRDGILDDHIVRHVLTQSSGPASLLPSKYYDGYSPYFADWTYGPRGIIRASTSSKTPWDKDALVRLGFHENALEYAASHYHDSMRSRRQMESFSAPAVPQYSIAARHIDTTSLVLIEKVRDSSNRPITRAASIAFSDGDGTVPAVSASDNPSEEFDVLREEHRICDLDAELSQSDNHGNLFLSQAVLEVIREIHAGRVPSACLQSSSWTQSAALRTASAMPSAQSSEFTLATFTAVIQGAHEVLVVDPRTVAVTGFVDGEARRDLPAIDIDKMEDTFTVSGPLHGVRQVVVIPADDSSTNAHGTSIEIDVRDVSRLDNGTVSVVPSASLGFTEVELTEGSTAYIDLDPLGSIEDVVLTELKEDGSVEEHVARFAQDQRSSLDLTPPITELEGRSSSPRHMTVAAVAQDDGSGVLDTFISTDSGGTWQRYVRPIRVERGDLVSVVKAYSVDRAGNQESRVAVLEVPIASPSTDVPPSPSPVSRLSPVYLPIALTESCYEGHQPNVHLVFAIDTSTSMGSPMPDGSSRLESAVRLAVEVLEHMNLEAGARGDSDQAAVVSFDGTAEIVRALSSDKQGIRRALAELELAEVPGTRLDLAFERASEALGLSPRTLNYEAVVILFSDGIPRGVPSHSQSGRMDETVIDAARVAASMELHVYPVGLDSVSVGSRARSLLEQCASRRARSHFDPPASELHAVYDYLTSPFACPTGRHDWSQPWPPPRGRLRP